MANKIPNFVLRFVPFRLMSEDSVKNLNLL